MKDAAKYILLTVIFGFLSSGIVVAGFMDVYDVIGYNLLWPLLLIMLLFMAAVVFNDRILIPGLLLKGRYATYCVSAFGVIYVLSDVSLGFEYAVRSYFDLPMRIADYGNPWILADIIGNSLLMALILLGLGMLHIFNRWKSEVASEISFTDKLENYINTVNNCLNPSHILRRMDSVSECGTTNPEEIDSRIRDLSNYLRKQLHELPTPPQIDTTTGDETGHSRIARWLVADRYRRARHLLLLSLLLFISCGAFFDTPDCPVFTLQRLVSVLAMFVILALLAYVNILWLYPRFKKRGNMRRYAISVASVVAAIAVPLVVAQMLTYEPNVYSKTLPVGIAILATGGSLCSLFMFVGGISAMLLLRDWIMTKRRIVMLRAETVRQEYAYLRKQINPHFLFNVLNNIGIMAYDDPEESLELLDDLKSLLAYQFKDMQREHTTAGDEAQFLQSYLALEKSRRENFSYNVVCYPSDYDVTIPTLLLIPFVENAVKYSPRPGGEVSVQFMTGDDKLTFECRNPFSSDSVSQQQHGGIGLSNTRRRLSMLYDNRYNLNVLVNDTIFTVKLEIPLK